MKNTLFAINLVAGIVLILSNLAEIIPPSQNTWIQALGLIYPIIIIVNLAFLISWVIAKSKFAVLSFIFILIGFNNIFNNFQITLLNSVNKQAGEIKVLSYNVQNFGEKNNNNSAIVTKSRIIKFLLKQDADIVCIQEYHSSNNSLYEPLKEIRDTLSSHSYYYESYFNPKHNQLSGLVTFSKYNAINKGRLKFKGSRTFGIYTDVVLNEDTVRIFNIHLASIKLVPGDLDFVVKPEADNSEILKNHYLEIYRKLAQAFNLREKQLKYLINKINLTKYDIILCGDFNDTPSSWVYSQLEKYMTDTFVKKGIGVGRTYAGPLPFLRIDYILTGKRFSTHGFTRHSLKESDHYPISAIIE
ncbi:MAG: endonuclease/exonuclease/phosphatase family protein [Bacteroidetes bacterium]|nr:endonuclease/exonuclease/phosphatase family protein [Bacteroidota bacterium]